MYSISLQTNPNFQLFLRISDAEYVDVFLNPGSALFIQNTNEVFSMIQLPVSCTVGEESRAFRIKRGVLKSVSGSGRVECTVRPESVQLKSFEEDERVRYIVTVRNEMVFASIYSDKLDYLSKHSSYEYFDIRELKDMQKIAKAAGSTLNLDNNACGIIFPEGIRVYKRYSCEAPIGISARGFEALRKCSNLFFNVNNFIGAVNGTFAVLVNKVRFSDNEIFHDVAGERFGSSFIAKINIANLRAFLAEKRVEENFLTFSLEKQLCSLVVAGAEYSIPVYMNDVQKSERCSVTELKIPLRLFKTVFNNLPSSNYVLRVKQHFIQLEQNDYYILFK